MRTTQLETKKRIVTEEQSIFGRYSCVVLMKVILWYLSYLYQAAAIQENSYLRISTVRPEHSPLRERYNEGTYACINRSCMPQIESSTSSSEHSKHQKCSVPVRISRHSWDRDVITHKPQSSSAAIFYRSGFRIFPLIAFLSSHRCLLWLPCTTRRK